MKKVLSPWGLDVVIPIRLHLLFVYEANCDLCGFCFSFFFFFFFFFCLVFYFKRKGLFVIDSGPFGRLIVCIP